MSLQPQAIPPVPDETARVDHAILPSGSLLTWEFSLLESNRPLNTQEPPSEV